MEFGEEHLGLGDHGSIASPLVLFIQLRNVSKTDVLHRLIPIEKQGKGKESEKMGRERRCKGIQVCALEILVKGGRYEESTVSSMSDTMRSLGPGVSLSKCASHSSTSFCRSSSNLENVGGK